MKPHATVIATLAFGLAGAAQAQEADFGLSAGLKVWNTQWTTFGYDTNGGGQQVVTQVPARPFLRPAFEKFRAGAGRRLLERIAAQLGLSP